MSGRLEARGVTHMFGGLRAVDDWSIVLEPGELVGLIGPNGAGKSTVFNLITGVYRATRGSIRFDGVELVGRRSNRIAACGIARTFQGIRLFKDLTVLDNVRVAHYVKMRYSLMEALFRTGRYHGAEDRVVGHSRELLEAFGLAEYAAERASSLPYGQQRRLEIARALATEPRLLLLDEPAAGMNPNEVGRMMEFISWVRREYRLTVLLIEHQMRLVMGICERIQVLDFGATIAQGTPDEIRNNQRVLEAYLGPAEEGE
ncbi:MAG: ABC transporter ATP-binding protein [bacterium]